MRALLRRLSGRSVTLILLETVLIVSAVAAASFVRLQGETVDIMLNEDGAVKALLVAFVAQICLYYADLYNLRQVADRRELFVRIVQALASASFLLAAIYYWFPSLVIGRGVFMIAAGLVLVLVVGWRVLFEWLSRSMGPRERLLLVGTSSAAVSLARELFERRHELGVDIVGFVDPDPARVGAPVINPGVIGTIEDIPGVVRDCGVHRVVVSLSDARGKLPMDQLLDMKLAGVTFDHLASVYEEYTGKIAVERLLDIVVACIGLFIAAPIMLLVAAAVKMTSRGPALYHQQRVGLNGRIFTVHKFRSMRHDAEALTGPVWAAKTGDPRVTPIGRFLRRSRLDELPQLWNVLVGEMSFVGPRPERPEFVRELTAEIPYYGQRHVVRPGLTGWAQVRYSYGASKEDALEKLQYDLYYIKNLSFALDLLIIVETIKTVVLRRGT
jgi:lipopolysaccharide/colanic/teichoic acid biosynthesis glycosyltransferase